MVNLQTFERVAKSPIRDFSLHGKGKTWFSLSSRTHDLPTESWIRAARARAALLVVNRVAKSPIRDLTLPGKGKAWFSLSSRIHDSRFASWIRAPRAGRVDGFLRVHQPLKRDNLDGEPLERERKRPAGSPEKPMPDAFILFPQLWFCPGKEVSKS